MCVCLDSTHVADSIKSTLILADGHWKRSGEEEEEEEKNVNPQSSRHDPAVSDANDWAWLPHGKHKESHFMLKHKTSAKCILG